MKKLGEFKCSKCGWVQFSTSEDVDIAAVADFNEYFATLSPEVQVDSGGKPASLDGDKKCFRCGAPAADFVPSAPGDAPDGCTLQVVIAGPTE